MTHQKPHQNTTNQGETQEIGGEAVTCGSCTEIGKSEGQAGGGTKGGAPACGSDPCGDGRVLCQLPKSHAGQHSETDDGRTFTESPNPQSEENSGAVRVGDAGPNTCACRVPWGPYRGNACTRPDGHEGPHRAHPKTRRGAETIEWAPIARPAGVL